MLCNQICDKGLKGFLPLLFCERSRNVTRYRFSAPSSHDSPNMGDLRLR